MEEETSLISVVDALDLDDMYAEICAYLTSHHYFDLPTDRVRHLFVVDSREDSCSIFRSH